jgi:uroporphyrinogen III methyltransferase/synthase
LIEDHRRVVAERGTVYLVGAGPGDPGLLTVRGRALLDDCDAVVHDALVSPEMLVARMRTSHRPEIHFVGKRGGDRTSIRQDDINTTLIRLAREGKSVVRLKGGDPFVFGRGGEEALALVAARVRFEIVPGVTAGTAGPAYAGVPVTHRGLATAVTFVTGHEDSAKPDAQTDWAALARAGGTIVLYMGVGRLRVITDALAAGGMPTHTPAAAVQWGTTAAQQTVDGTLGTIADQARAAGLTAPVITIIGRVVGLREQIRWFDRPETRPLLGRRILVTRATQRAPALSDQLRSLGAAVIEMAATRIEPLDPAPLASALTRLHQYQHIVFTSQTAVSFVWDALRARGRDARAFAGITIAAVGPTTAAALLERGLAIDVAADRFVAEGVLQAYRARPDVGGARVLYPAAADAREVLPDGLRTLGATVDVVPIYRSVADEQGAVALRAAVSSGAVDLVTLASASAVRAYVDAVGSGLAARVAAVSIGPVTSDAARAAGIPVAAEAGESTMSGLADAVVRACALRGVGSDGAVTPPAASECLS